MRVRGLRDGAEPLPRLRQQFGKRGRPLIGQRQGDERLPREEAFALDGGAAVQVRTAAFGYGANNWRRVRLLEDRIEVFTTGAP